MACGLQQGLFVADLAFSWIIVFPFSVFYWRGSWDIWDYYVKIDCVGLNRTEDPDRPGRFYPTNNLYKGKSEKEECTEVRGLWLAALVGYTVCVLVNILSPLLEKHVNRKVMHVVPYTIFVKLYCYIMAFANMGFWLGVWNLSDHYGQDDWRSNLIGLGASLGLSFLLRVSIQAKSEPWDVGTEIQGYVFECLTWLRRRPEKDGLWMWCMDVAVTQIVHIIPIFQWRCMWNIMDKCIIPWQADLSAGVTLGAGLGGLLILAFVAFPVSRISAALDSKPLFWKIVLEDIWYVIVNGGVVLAWRGEWNLIAEHVLPDLVVGGWSCHAIGFVVLAILCQTNAIFDNSITRDGDYMNGEGILPKVDYFQYIFRDKIEQESDLDSIVDAGEANKYNHGNSQMCFKNNCFVASTESFKGKSSD